MEKKNPPVVLPEFKNKRTNQAPDGVQADQEEEEEYIDVISFPGAKVPTDENLTRSFPTPVPLSKVELGKPEKPVIFPDWVFKGLAEKDEEE